MGKKIENRIIIIGGNHTNALSAIRCFGLCGCKIHVLLHLDDFIQTPNCAKTRYSKNKTSVVAKDENAIVKWLNENKKDEMQILFPCSDFAGYVIDMHYQELSKNYILPGFKNSPGKVCELMGKWEQYLLAKENDINVAKSWLFELSNCELDFANIDFPCIVKPETSALGKKSDIVICQDKDSIECVINDFAKKKYSRIIVQELLLNNEEYLSMGCIGNDIVVSDTFKKNIRHQGNTVYATFCRNEKVEALHQKILNILKSQGYDGMFDIEYLESNGKVYLNEINIRHSGLGFGQIDNKVYAPYIWVLSILGLDIPKKYFKKVPVGKTLIDETVCFTHRKQFDLSLPKWFWLCITASAHANFNIHDIRGTLAAYMSKLRKR